MAVDLWEGMEAKSPQETGCNDETEIHCPRDYSGRCFGLVPDESSSRAEHMETGACEEAGGKYTPFRGCDSDAVECR